jgi:hypothetical protein
MEPISFASKVECKEYLKLAFLQYFQNGVVWFIYIVCSCLIFISLSSDNSSHDSVIIIASIAVMVIIPLRAFLRFRKAYRHNPVAGTEIHWTITESSVSFKQGSTSGEVGWDRISKIKDNKQWIMLWYNNRPSFNFQKRYLSPAQIVSFKAIIHSMRKGYLKH